MNELKIKIEAALTEIAREDIPEAIRHLTTLDKADEIFFALTDLRKKMSFVDSWIFDLRHQDASIAVTPTERSIPNSSR